MQRVTNLEALVLNPDMPEKERHKAFLDLLPLANIETLNKLFRHIDITRIDQIDDPNDSPTFPGSVLFYSAVFHKRLDVLQWLRSTLADDYFVSADEDENQWDLISKMKVDLVTIAAINGSTEILDFLLKPFKKGGLECSFYALEEMNGAEGYGVEVAAIMTGQIEMLRHVDRDLEQARLDFKWASDKKSALTYAMQFNQLQTLQTLLMPKELNGFGISYPHYNDFRFRSTYLNPTGIWFVTQLFQQAKQATNVSQALAWFRSAILSGLSANDSMDALIEALTDITPREIYLSIFDDKKCSLALRQHAGLKLAAFAFQGTAQSAMQAYHYLEGNESPEAVALRCRLDETVKMIDRTALQRFAFSSTSASSLKRPRDGDDDKDNETQTKRPRTTPPI